MLCHTQAFYYATGLLFSGLMIGPGYTAIHGT